MNFHIVTLFPDSISGYINHSILKRAITDKKISVTFYNPKDFTEGKERVDDKPYGGGPGMVMKALPVIKSIENAKGRKRKVKIILTSPQGAQFTNSYAQNVATSFKDVIIIAGRYEGVDSRIKEAFPMDDISVGPYVLTGGELPAMIMVDTISRQIPGILGNFDSVEEGRAASEEMYTRPSEFKYKRKKYSVPEVFLSGHHARVEERRKKGDKRKSKK